MNKEKNTILVITSLSHLTVHAQMMVFPTLIILFNNKFGFTLDILGMIASIGAFMFGVGAIPAGILESRIGGRALLLIYQIGSILGCLIIILSQNLIQIAIGIGVLGIASSIYHPAGLTILSYKITNLSKGLAYHGIAGSLGLALGPIIAGIMAEFYFWQASYILWVFLQIFMAIITFTMIDDTNRTEEKLYSGHTKIIDNRAVILYYIMAITLGFAFGGFTTFMPTLFGMQDEGVFSAFPQILKAGAFTTLVFLSGIIGQMIGGLLGNKYNRSYLILIIIIFNIPLIALLGYASGTSLLICSILMGMIYFSNQPISNALLADLTSDSHRGLGYGISFFLSFGIGGIAPAICGWITNYYSVEMLFPFIALSLLPGVLAGWLLLQRLNQTS